MDRCRCPEYEAAVKKMRFYTIGTYRPDIIDNFDRSGYTVAWLQHAPDFVDLRFEYPKAYRLYQPQELPDHHLTQQARKIEQMWCPFMTPIKQGAKRIDMK